MNIRRQYSLPNCTLIVDGMSDAIATPQSQPDPRPLMSIVVNTECHLPALEKPLTGGRDFLESLVKSVSSYAQEWLSGVPQPKLDGEKPSLVLLHKVNGEDLHQLIAQPEANTPGLGSYTSTSQTNNTQEPIKIDLNTVQLFDLVEAVDQFLADTRTLPDLSLHLQPVSKKYIAAREPLTKRATPAAVGITTLALAAIALSSIPVPKVEKPKDLTPEQPNSTLPSPDATATPLSTASPTPSPDATATPLSTASPTPTTSPQPTPESTTTPTTSPSPQPTPQANTAPPSATEMSAIFASAKDITDPTQLRFLERKLYNNIAQTWNAKPQRLREKLIYRVGVGKDGAIIGYKPINRTASDRIKDTPLPELIYNQTSNSSSNREAIGQFKVVFTERGILQVNPWFGYKAKPSLGPEITDRSQIKDLNKKISTQIRENWKGTPTYKENLSYRVAVNKDGVIADYEPLNQPGFDYVGQTPLPNMLKSNNIPSALPEEPLAQFKVVFKPSGVLEISPMRGNRSR